MFCQSGNYMNMGCIQSSNGTPTPNFFPSYRPPLLPARPPPPPPPPPTHTHTPTHRESLYAAIHWGTKITKQSRFTPSFKMQWEPWAIMTNARENVTL